MKQLNLACGHVILPKEDNWLNLDKYYINGVDIVAEIPPIPFKDESFDHILVSHFLEHVSAGKPIIDVMNECWRILRPNGTMHVEVPYWNTEEYVRDPTHVQPWNMDKFRYFVDEFSYLGYGIKTWTSYVATQDVFGIISADLVK